MYKYNCYKGQYYSYDISELAEIQNPHMFDDSLHDNCIEPKILYRGMCAYCGCIFPSRNKLFHHLNFMNIDTRKKGEDSMLEDVPKLPKKKHRSYSFRKYYFGRKKKINKHKQRSIKDVSLLLENIKL